MSLKWAIRARVFCALYAAPLDGEARGACGMALDFARRDRGAAKDIRGHRKRAHSFLTLLAASVAHEIGNPLNALHIHLQLLSQGSQKTAPSASSAATRAVSRAASRRRIREVAEIAAETGALSGRGQGGNHAAGLHRHPIPAGHPAFAAAIGARLAQRRGAGDAGIAASGTGESGVERQGEAGARVCRWRRWTPAR